MSSSSPSSSPATFVTHLLASLSSHPPPHPASSTHSTDTDAVADHIAATSRPPNGSLQLGPASAAQTWSTSTTSPPNNPLQNAPDAVRKQLLTLHVLFPNEFLPALDLLDRGLVTRLVIAREEDDVEDGRAGEGDGSVGHVQGRAGGGDAGTGPKVREEHKEMEKGEGKEKEAHPPFPENSGNFAQEHPKSRVPHSEPAHPEKHTNDAPRATTHETAFYLVRSAQPRPPHDRPSRYPNSSTTTTTAPPPSSSSSTTPPQKTYQVRLPSWTCTCPTFAFAAFPALPTNHSESRREPEEVDPRRFFSALVEDRIHPSAREDDAERNWVFGGVALNGDKAMPPVCKHLLACVLGERGVLFGGFVGVRRVGVEEAVGWGAGWGD